MGYPEVVSWPSDFIMNVSQCLVCILTRLSSSLIPTTLAHFYSLLSCMRIKCWVSITTCVRSVFAVDAIQSGLNGSQLTRITIVLVKWHANVNEFWLAWSHFKNFASNWRSSISRQPCCSRASLYVISASCLVPSSNWQYRVKWPHVADHIMALGISIYKPPSSVGKVKRTVDVFGDICQTSLLHLTKVTVSFLNSFSGQIITGHEKARRGSRVHSISLRLFSIERSLFLRMKQTISVILSITYLLWAVVSNHMLYRIPRSRMGVFGHGLPSALFRYT